MGLFRRWGSAFWIGLLAVAGALAAGAASNHRKQAEKWRDTAVDIETGNVTKGTTTAKAAISQAKLHEAKAEEIKKKAEARIDKMGAKDEEMAIILDRWRKS